MEPSPDTPSSASIDPSRLASGTGRFDTTEEPDSLGTENDTSIDDAEVAEKQQEQQDREADDEVAGAAEAFATESGQQKYKFYANLGDKSAVVSVVVKPLRNGVWRYSLVREANQSIDKNEGTTKLLEDHMDTDTKGWDLRIDAVTTKNLTFGPAPGEPTGTKGPSGVYLQTVAGSVKPPDDYREYAVATQVAFQLIYAPSKEDDFETSESNQTAQPYVDWRARAGRGKIAELTGFGSIPATQIDQVDAFWGDKGDTKLVPKFNTSTPSAIPYGTPILTEYDPCIHTEGLYKVKPGDHDVQKKKGNKGRMTGTNESPAKFRFAVFESETETMTMARFFKPSEKDIVKAIEADNAASAPAST